MYPLRFQRLAALFVVVLLFALPQMGQAQTQAVSFCTLYQQSPQTEDLRSAINEEWDSDTGEWSSHTRTIITYDANRASEVRIQQRGSAGAWRDTSRSQPTYDSADRLVRCTTEEPKNGTFVNSLRMDYSYDSEGHVEVQTTLVWDTTSANPEGTWVNGIRSNYTNDGGNVVERVDEAWDRDSESWVDIRRDQNSYNEDDQLTEKVEQITDGSGGWINQRRTQNSYGADGITESVVETWNLTSLAWENSERTQYSYPSANTREEVDHNWNGSSWVNVERRTVTLNSNDFPETEVTESWTGSEWSNSARSETSYTTHDGTQKIQQSLDQSWDASANDWVNAERVRYSYTDIIPVELASFSVQNDADQAVLRWQTASETNNAGFDVQHRTSTAGPWQTLGFVESNVPGGTTSQPQSYRYRTESLAPGTHRFRLRQVDLDGSSELSDVIAVEVQMEDLLRLSAPTPNPVTDRSTLSFALETEAEAQITLYNVLGRKVATLYEGTPATGEKQTVHLDAETLSSGIYILQLRADGHTRTQRVAVVK